MKILAIAAAAFALMGCAAQPQQQKGGGAAATDTSIADRITRICALPESQRAAEIEKLKKETGLVLYCGRGEER